MKILMSNPDNTLGFALPENNNVQTIGLFDSLLIEAQIAALGAFAVFSKAVEPQVIKLALIDKDGVKCLAMRPADAKGEAWVVLAPRIEAD